jgi:hypothetical protein
VHALGLPARAAVLYHAYQQRPARRLPLVAAALALLAIVAGVRESWQTVSKDWRYPGRATRAMRPADFPAGIDALFPGMSEAPGFREALASNAIARRRWRSGYGTLLGGTLGMPLGRRLITVVPPHTGNFRDPWSEAYDTTAPGRSELMALAAAGTEWLIWDSESADDVPPSVAECAGDHYVYHHEVSRYYFHLARLKVPALAGALP